MDVLTREKCLRCLLAMLALGTADSAIANDLDARRLTFGGFGTIGALYHNEDDIEYRRSISQPRGAEGGEADFATDTIGGVQLNAAWNTQLEVVVQATTRLTADGDWTPELTRAFLRYNPNEVVSLRAGRIGWEIYPRADSRDIGYSQLNIRPAVEVFGISPSEHFDGGELALKRPFGDALVSLKLYGGSGDGKVALQDGSVNSVAGSKVWGGHIDYEQGPWVLRLGSGVFEQEEPPPLDALAAGLRMTGEPQAVALGNDFAANGRKTLFFVGGAAYDKGPVQARLFAAYVDSEYAVSPNLYVGQIIGGYRIGALTPYASFSIVRNSDDIRGTGLPDEPQYAALNAGAYAAQSAFRYNQHSLALGLRWDFLPKLALKFQVDQVWLRDSRLVFDRRPDPSADAEMTLLGLALDFVF